MVKPEDFVAEDTSVKWTLLATTIFGGGVLAFFDGIMGSILALFRQVGDLWTGLGEFLATVVSKWLGAPTQALEDGYEAFMGAAFEADYSLSDPILERIVYVGDYELALPTLPTEPSGGFFGFLGFLIGVAAVVVLLYVLAQGVDWIGS